MESNYTLVIPGIRRKLGCGQVKAEQIVKAEIVPVTRIGDRRYARVEDIESLPEKFADPAVQERYFAASYDRKRRAHRANAAAAELASLTRATRKARG